MSHQCKQKGSSRSILNYSDSLPRGPQQKYSPPVSTVTSQPAQDTTVAAKAQNTVLRVKRKKTRRELNHAKFGKVIVEKLSSYRPGHVAQLRQSVKCHCKHAGNSWAAERAAPKLSLNSNWAITQNRLSQHLGIFNKEVKSVAIERLLKVDLTQKCWQGNTKEPIPQPAEVAMEVASCTPIQRKGVDAVVSAEQSSSPMLIPKEQGPQPAVEGGSAGQLPAAEAPPFRGAETSVQLPSAAMRQAPPITDLAQKLVKTLNTHHAFPGHNLVQQTQQQLLDLLVKGHRGLPHNLLSALRREQECGITAGTTEVPGLSRLENTGIEPLDGTSIASKLPATGDQFIEETFLIRKDSKTCEFPMHSTPVTVNRPSNRKHDPTGFSGLRIWACFTDTPKFPVICSQKVAERNAGNAHGACAGTEENSSLKHPSQQHGWLWKNPDDSQTARVTFQSPTIVKRPSESGWILGAGLGKAVHRDPSQSKRLVPMAEKHLFSNSASPQFTSHMHKSTNSLVKIWEAYKDSPAPPHWGAFPGEAQSPAIWDPERLSKEWGNRGQPLEDIYKLSQHKLRDLGINLSDSAANGCGGTLERQNDLLEGEDVPGKHYHPKLPANTQHISFRGTKLTSEQSPSGFHAVQTPPRTYRCSSSQEMVHVFPERYDGLCHPFEHHSLGPSPLWLADRAAVDRWGSFHPKGLDSLLFQGCNVSKENSDHHYTQSHEPQAAEGTAPGHPGVLEKWPCPVVEAVKCTSVKASAPKSFLDWNGTLAHWPVSLDYPQPKVWPMPLSFYYPPSDAIEWDDSPLPVWCGVPQSHTWESTSPEPWLFPRMKLY